MTKESIDTILRDNPEIQLEILKDRVADIKRIDRNKNIFLLVILMLLIGLFIYIDFSNKAFLSQYNLGTDTDVETTATHSNNTTSNVNIGK